MAKPIGTYLIIRTVLLSLSNVSLLWRCDSDHIIPFKIVELNGADPCSIFVNGSRQLEVSDVIRSQHNGKLEYPIRQTV